MGAYTAAALAGIAVSVVLDLFVLRTRLLARRIFWVSYAIIAFFQLVTNGVLTTQDIVVYDPDRITGLRLVGAPVEDLLFGFSLVVWAQSFWVWWGRRGVQNRPVRVAPRLPASLGERWVRPDGAAPR